MLHLLKRGSLYDCDFALKMRDTAQGYLKCVPPQILGLIGYQICLVMVLCWRAMCAGSATNKTEPLF